MIRSALIAFGLSAGAAGAQGMVSTAPVLESCGGTRLVLAAADDADTNQLERAAGVVSARIGGLFGGVFDFADLVDDRIVVSLPVGMKADRETLALLLQRVDFEFLQVVKRVSLHETVAAPNGQSVLPQANDPLLGFVVKNDPVLDGTAVVFADATFDQHARPAVSFRLSDTASNMFGQFTEENIGEPFAIVLRGEIISAPTIQSAIWGGSGIITGHFTTAEAHQLAALLQAGVLPFGLEVLSEESVDGSDPSADFCP